MGALRYIAATTVMLAGISPASAVDVGRVPAISGGVVEARFAANPALGRAWVEVTVRDPTLRDESPLTQVVHESRFTVPGLTFDAATSRIVLATGTRRIDCAEVDNGRTLFGTAPSVKSTGRCEIATEPTTLAEDDGFHVREKEHFQLRLRVTESSGD